MNFLDLDVMFYPCPKGEFRVASVAKLKIDRVQLFPEDMRPPSDVFVACAYFSAPVGLLSGTSES